ncbi:MAG: hypothetical protein GX221_03755 [Candidatus Riflebacteria bacterium]|nr:hypothetical protein [Candidatus Riflebacteria bacterium]
MDITTSEKKIIYCPYCRTANYHLADFCRGCSQSLSETLQKSAENEPEPTGLTKHVYMLIDAAFAIIDEIKRWIHIGRLNVTLNVLYRKRAALLKKTAQMSESRFEVSPELKYELAIITEDLNAQASDEIYYRSRSWQRTPQLFFLLILALFIYGLAVYTPTRRIQPGTTANHSIFSGQISHIKDFPIIGHSIITSAAWHKNKLYVGGNGGLTLIDTVTGTATQTIGLPENFFVRDLTSNGDTLYAGGFPGIYKIAEEDVSKFAPEASLDNSLINRISMWQHNKLMIGTINKGLLIADKEDVQSIKSTQDRIINDFGKIGKSIWILSEDGLLTGKLNSLEPMNLQILAGKKLKKLIVTKNRIFIGTDQGVITCYKSTRDWVWTILSTDKPGHINDMAAVGETLFIASDEGVYRASQGRMDRLTAVPSSALAICDTFLAAICNNSVVLYYFVPGSKHSDSSLFGPIPQLGTYTPSLPIAVKEKQDRWQSLRTPELGLMDTDNKQIFGATKAENSKHTSPALPKPHIELPLELQMPIFTEIADLGDKYALATKNRGIWLYESQSWKQLKAPEELTATKLAVNTSGLCFIYGDGKGIYKIENDEAKEVLTKEHTENLIFASLTTSNTLIMLYSDGYIKEFTETSSAPEILFKKPQNFKAELFSVFKSGNSFFLPSDRGIVKREPDGKWNLVFYSGQKSKIESSLITENGVLYTALFDGRVFEYAEEGLRLIGILPNTPITLTYSTNLSAVSGQEIYTYDNKRFIPIPFKGEEQILGVFTQPDSKKMLIFTESGVKTQ